METVGFMQHIGGTNQAPSVTLTAPLATAQVKAGEVMTLAANASDADGSVARVEFSVDGVLVGQATKARTARAGQRPKERMNLVRLPLMIKGLSAPKMQSL